jgi:hypothetical protein
MPLTTAGRNAVLDSGIPAITHVGALTALTGTEVAGGSYARQSISHAAAASGVKDNSAQITIPIPAGTTVVAVSEYDAASAGNQLSYGGIGSTVKGVGTAATTDTITSNGHGLVDNDRVFVWAVNGESLPTGLSASTLYHVISSASNTFQLSTSQGGAAVDITAVGELAFAKTVPETFASAGNLVFAAGALDHDATFG